MSSSTTEAEIMALKALRFIRIKLKTAARRGLPRGTQEDQAKHSHETQVEIQRVKRDS